MQKVEKVKGGGWESIVYIVILIATFFQDKTGQIWGCEGGRHSAVWDGKGSDVAQLGAKTPAKMIVINQATHVNWSIEELDQKDVSSPSACLEHFPNRLEQIKSTIWDIHHNLIH